MGSILYLWRDVAGIGPVREWTARGISTDDGAVDVARALKGSGVGGPLGSHAIAEFPQVERTVVASLLDLDDLVARLRGFREGADPSRALVVDGFPRGLSSEC